MKIRISKESSFDLRDFIFNSFFLLKLFGKHKIYNFFLYHFILFDKYNSNLYKYKF